MTDKDLATNRWKTLRVFISSTFRDFHAERDYLIKNVFPELRQWCEQYNLHIVDIDLRWGITEAQAQSGKVIDICLEQIDDCRPFFICMLGNRYGWVPSYENIPEKTLAHYHRLGDHNKQSISITHMEIQHAIFNPLTSLDNHQPASRAFFYFRDENCLPKPEEMLTYSEKQRLEYAKAFFESDEESQNKLKTLKINIKNHYDNIGQEKKNKQEVEERIFTYQPEFDSNLRNPEDDFLKGRFKALSLREFGDRVENDLKKAITLEFQKRIAYLSEKREEDSLERKLDQHEAFVENRTQVFIGRRELLNLLSEYVEGNSIKVLAVLGKPGSGKSSLLAKFYKNYQQDTQRNLKNSEAIFIPHFVGASPKSSSLNSMLRRFCEIIFNRGLKNEYESRKGEIVSKQGETEDTTALQKQIKELEKEFEIPIETNKLIKTFFYFLGKTKNTIVILIDGLNQLDEMDNAHKLHWLPGHLRENVKIITSTIEGSAWESLQKKTDQIIEVTPLTLEERREIIETMPSIFAKTLPEDHKNLLLKRDETKNPLYLRIALEELRVFGGFGRSGEKLEQLIQSFPSDVVNMFVFILNRLERVRCSPLSRQKITIFKILSELLLFLYCDMLFYSNHLIENGFQQVFCNRATDGAVYDYKTRYTSQFHICPLGHCDNRALFDVNWEQEEIGILKIGHRRDVY